MWIAYGVINQSKLFKTQCSPNFKTARIHQISATLSENPSTYSLSPPTTFPAKPSLNRAAESWIGRKAKSFWYPQSNERKKKLNESYLPRFLKILEATNKLRYLANHKKTFWFIGFGRALLKIQGLGQSARFAQLLVTPLLLLNVFSLFK